MIAAHDANVILLGRRDVPISWQAEPFSASTATAHRVPRTLYIRPHAFRNVSRHLRRAPHRGTQRLRDGPRARGRDALVRVRRGHPAPDDALRGELRVVRDLLHAFSRRPFPRSDGADPHAGTTDACGTDEVVRTEGRQEAVESGTAARGGKSPV